MSCQSCNKSGANRLCMCPFEGVETLCLPDFSSMRRSLLSLKLVRFFNCLPFYFNHHVVRSTCKSLQNELL